MAIDPLYLFVFVGLFTPGPNVILLTASGARFGFRRSIPHGIGIVVGAGIIAAATALGVGAVLLAFPALDLALRVAAAVWIFWLAAQLWRAPMRNSGAGRDRPFTAIEAILFQWINPKVWAVALAAAGGYPSGLPPLAEALRLASAFSGLNVIVCLFWGTAGSLLAYLLTHERAWTVFMRVMSVLLAASGLMVFL